MEVLMSESGNQELDVAELMARIREAAEKRKSNSLIDASGTLYRLLKTDGWSGSSQNGTSFPPQITTTPLSLQSEFEPKAYYHVNDLLVFHDQTFVRNAYKAILQRAPDDSGFVQQLENLRSGRFNKIDVLASLRFSPEGRWRNVRIDGLTTPALFRKLYRVPVLGYLLELLVGLIRLPVFVANYRRLEAYSAAQNDCLAKHINLNADCLAKHINLNADKLNEMSRELSNRLVEAAREISETHKKIAGLHYQQIKTLFREQRELTEDQNRLKSDISSHLSVTQDQFKEHTRIQEKHAEELLELKSLIESNVTQKLQQTRMELVLQERRLTLFLEEARKRLPEPFDKSQLESLVKEKNHLLDSLYGSLEDQFRGTRGDIKERLQAYLPILDQAGATSHILDIGCGRGEWLEVMKEAGLSARGIDHNQVMIEQCSQLGLAAFQADAITYLQELADRSLSCVTAFHIAEHLALETLISFLDEVARTLKPGGLVILETPNPENVLVGSCNFYLDPTHRNPIPSATMQFLLESRGFCRLEVLMLHPMISERIKGNDELTKNFNKYFFGPMDYAILGRKL